MKMVSFIVFFMLTTTNGMAATSFEDQLDVNAVPNFSLRWMNHPTNTQILWNSAEFNDAVYVVEGYFDNCPYCHENAPRINQLSGEFAAESPQVKVLDISRDCSEGEYRQWISSTKPNHPVLNDCEMDVLGPLSIRGYPTTVVLDCNLNQVWRHEGSMEPSDVAALRRAVQNQLARECNRG